MQRRSPTKPPRGKALPERRSPSAAFSGKAQRSLKGQSVSAGAQVGTAPANTAPQRDTPSGAVTPEEFAAKPHPGSRRVSGLGSQIRNSGAGAGSKQTLGRDARLKSRDIAKMRDAGEKLYAKHFLLVVVKRARFAPSDASAPLSDSPSRLAIAVTTKIDKRATVRNRIKRRVREVFRCCRAGLKTPIDLLVVARRDVQHCHFEQYERELVGALRKGGYL